MVREEGGGGRARRAVDCAVDSPRVCVNVRFHTFGTTTRKRKLRPPQDTMAEGAERFRGLWEDEMFARHHHFMHLVFQSGHTRRKKCDSFRFSRYLWPRASICL